MSATGPSSRRRVAAGWEVRALAADVPRQGDGRLRRRHHRAAAAATASRRCGGAAGGVTQHTRAARNDRARRASVSLGGWHKENRGRRSGELGMGPSSGKAPSQQCLAADVLFSPPLARTSDGLARIAKLGLACELPPCRSEERGPRPSTNAKPLRPPAPLGPLDLPQPAVAFISPACFYFSPTLCRRPSPLLPPGAESSLGSWEHGSRARNRWTILNE